MKFSLLKRGNLAYPVMTLILFLVLALTASSVPVTFLQQVQGYKPLQAQTVTLIVALPQLVLLPFTAWLLDHKHVDARWVNAAGYVLVLIACGMGTYLTSNWNRDQFYVQQLIESVGFAFIVMPLLLIATNSITADDAPYGSALVNTPRAVAEGLGVWTIQLIARWRGGLHRDRIVDLVGQNRLTLEQLRVLPAVTPDAPDARYGAINAEITRQVQTLTAIDSYVILAGIALFLMVALWVMVTRTYPPRIALAKH